MGEQRQGAMAGSLKDGISYWDAQYAGDSSDFDWYQQYGHLEVLLSAISNDSTVLVAGSGTSKVGVELANRGVATVTNLEQCGAAVDAMKGRWSAANCKWEKGDVTAM